MRDRFGPLRRIPLTAVLQACGAQPDRYDKAKWHTSEGTFSITGTKFMNWQRSQGGGGAIDLVMHLNHLTFPAAVRWLERQFPTPPPAPSDQSSPRRLSLPPPDSNQLPAVTRYLQQRAIPESLIQSLVESGELYADGRANAVFLLRGKENQTVGAELRGTGPVRWLGLAPGSRKNLGYFSLHSPGATTIILCESAIDTISCFLLHPGSEAISTAGARPNPRWLPALLAQGYPVYCGFDTDDTGEYLARQMMALYPGVRRLRPSQHDWNDVLRSHPQIPLPLPSA
jgi:protein strawberry notch